MWADTLLRAEQLHLLRVLAWGALTVLVGTALTVAGSMPRGRGSILRPLGAPLAGLGVVEVVAAGAMYRAAALTDAAGAVRLQNLAWLQLGLFAGCAAAGVLLAVVSRAARLPRASGAGVALAVHGAALVALTAAFVPAVSR